jgi:hypothetical protein
MTAVIIRSHYRPVPVVILDADLLDVFDLDRDSYEWLDCRASRTADLASVDELIWVSTAVSQPK